VSARVLAASVIFVTMPLSSTVYANPSPPAFDPANYSNGNGLTRAKAIVLLSRSEAGGVASEASWVAHFYPRSKVVHQVLTTWDEGKRYDILTVETSAMHKIILWFDVTLIFKD
jgi:hypothetical protein